jgi:hypothetical protein
MLIQRRNGFDQEADRLRTWIAEATHGLTPPAPSRPKSRIVPPINSPSS